MPEPLEYHLANIRAFLTQGFSAEELYYLCYDDPELHPVVQQISGDMGTASVASRILEFCRRRALLDRLLALGRKENPGRYPLHLPYYVEAEDAGASTARGAETRDWRMNKAGESAVSRGPAPDAARKLTVFLCHANEDKPTIRALYQRLVQSGVEPWLDEASLIGGQNWEQEIRRVVHSTDLVLVCLSNRSVRKVGFVHKEIRRYILDAADRQPEGATFVVPLRLDDCPMPESLSRWHRIDYYEPGGYDQLLCALELRADELGVRQPQV